MKRIFDLTLKDWTQLVRDRKVFLFMLVMPIAFTLLFGVAFGGGSSSKSDPRLPVAYLDLDHSRFSGEMQAQLESSDVIRLEAMQNQDRLKLEKQVAGKKLAGLVVVPSGYGQALLAGQPVPITLVADENSQAGQAVQRVVNSAASRLAGAVNTADAAAKAAGTSGDSTFFNQTLDRVLTAWQNPPIQVQVAKAQAIQPQKEQSSVLSYAQTAPGMMLQFSIAGLLASAQVLVNERKSRTLQRLLTTTISRGQVLAGHFLAIFGLTLAQFAILIAFGQIILKLDYLSQPLATAVLAVSASACIAGMGLLIGVLAKDDNQAAIFSLVPMFVFAGLGGAWVPLEYTGKAFQAVGHITPVAWAMDGFKDILMRGEGMSTVWLPAAALTGYALLFLTAAAWKFTKE